MEINRIDRQLTVRRLSGMRLVHSPKAIGRLQDA